MSPELIEEVWSEWLEWRNAIKVSFGWNFRIPLTPDQLPSCDHGGSQREKISVLQTVNPVALPSSSHSLPVLVLF